MLRGSRLVKNTSTLSVILRNGAITAPKVGLAAQFFRLQHSTSEGSQNIDDVLSKLKGTNEINDLKTKPQGTRKPLSPEDIAKRNEKFQELAESINQMIKQGLQTDQSSNELVDSFFSALDKRRSMKDNFKSMKAFSETINSIISRSIFELNDPNQKKIPISPQEILNKAIFYGVASPPNFDLVAKYLLKQGESQDVLPLWVSYIEYRSAQNLNFIFGEREFIITTIIAFAEFTAGKNPQLENVRQLLQISGLPRISEITKQLSSILPESSERYKTINNALNQLIVASRNPNSLRDLKRAHEAATRGISPTIAAIYKDAKHISEVSGKPITIDTYVGFMNCFNYVNRSKEVFEIWNEILKSGNKPSIDAWNQLLEASGKNGQFSRRVGQAQGVFNKIPNPNAETYAKLYEIYTRFGEHELASNLLTPENLKSSVFVNVYLKSLSNDADIETLQTTLRRFQNSDVNLSITTYNQLLSRFTRAGEFSKAKRILNEMESTNITPDVATFSIILDMSLKAIIARGDIPTDKPIDDLVTAMADVGIKANNFTLTSIIDSLAKDKSSFPSAEFLFNKLKTRNQTNIISYVALISNAFNIGRQQVAENYFIELLNSDIKLAESNWSMLFEGWCKTRNVEKAREYLMKVQESPDAKRLLNKYSYFFLLKNANENNSVELANETLAAIIKNQFPINKLTLFTKSLIPLLASKGIEIPEAIQKK